MNIKTKYSLGDTIYYLERRYIKEQCTTCKGVKKINVTDGMHNWNIKCPDCKGKGKQSQVIRYVVTSGVIKGIVAKRGNHSSTKYYLENGISKQETALFVSCDEAITACGDLNRDLLIGQQMKKGSV